MERTPNHAPQEQLSEEDSVASVPGFRRLASDFTLFSVGGLAGKFIGVLLLPVLARMLSTTDLGRFDVLSTLTSVLVSALLLGLDVSTLRLFFDDASESTRARFIGSWLALLSTTTVVAVTVIVVARNAISTALFGTTHFGAAVALTALAFAGGSAHYFALTVCRMRGRPKTFTSLTIGLLGLYGVLTITLLVVWERSATAAMTGLAVASVVFGLVGLHTVVRMGIGRPDGAAMRQIARVGLPLAPGVIALWGAEFAHRAILLTETNATQVAYFSVAIRFGSIGVLAGTALQFAWHPHTFTRRDHPLAHDALAREARQIGMCVVALAVTVGIFAPEAVRIVAGPDYAAAIPAVGWSCVYAMFFGLFQILSLPTALDRRLGGVGIANGIAAAVSVTGTLLLASHYGASGAMGSIAVGGAISCLVVTATSRRGSSLRLPLGHLVGGAILGAVVVLSADLPAGGAPPLLRMVLALVAVIMLVVDGSVPAVLARLRPSPR